MQLVMLVSYKYVDCRERLALDSSLFGVEHRQVRIKCQRFLANGHVRFCSYLA